MKKILVYTPDPGHVVYRAIEQVVSTLLPDLEFCHNLNDLTDVGLIIDTTGITGLESSIEHKIKTSIPIEEVDDPTKAVARILEIVARYKRSIL